MLIILFLSHIQSDNLLTYLITVYISSSGNTCKQQFYNNVLEDSGSRYHWVTTVKVTGWQLVFEVINLPFFVCIVNLSVFNHSSKTTWKQQQLLPLYHCLMDHYFRYILKVNLNWLFKRTLALFMIVNFCYVFLFPNFLYVLNVWPAVRSFSMSPQTRMHHLISGTIWFLTRNFYAFSLLLAFRGRWATNHKSYIMWNKCSIFFSYQ